MNKKMICLGILSMLMITSFSVVTVSGIKLKNNSSDNDLTISSNNYPLHADIIIDGNEGFNETNGVISGDGQHLSPYLISAWNVKNIEITNTDAYFRISYCIANKILIENSGNGVVSNCQLFKEDKWDHIHGVKIINSDVCTVHNCIIENPLDWGILVRNSDYITIFDSQITQTGNNGGSFPIGIEIRKSEKNHVFNCEISNLYEGIESFMMDDTIINNNNFTNCSYMDIDGDDCLLYSNNFLKIGRFSAYGFGSDKNIWHKDGTGNYFDNYKGFDTDGDGIGDTAYVLSEHPSNVDEFPLMTAIGISSDSPTKPLKPDGDGSGKTGQPYTYTTSATDSDAEIRYCFDWGDGNLEWTGYYSSGEEISVEHAWDKNNDFEIRVVARDRYGFESDWSDPFTVTMPKSKPRIVNLLLDFLDNFPILQRFLELK